MNCPLCESKEIEIIENINIKSLVKLYEKFTKVNFKYLFGQRLDYCECENCKLRFFYPLIIGDEKFYNSLQKFDWYYVDEKDEYLEAKKYIGKDDKVLDVGSGRGAFAKHLLTKDFIGLDSSERAREMASEDGIVVENEMIQDYVKKNEGMFDVVTSFQVLEHVLNPKEFIESKLKALKSGGKLIIAVPSEDSFLKYVSNGILNVPPHHVTRWNIDALKFIADKYNLKVLSIQHEKMRGTHKLEYVNAFIQNSLMKPKLIDTSFKRKVVNIFTVCFAKILVKGAQGNLLPNGHTVIAVFEKQ